MTEENRTITVAHSPDSDDAFMFYGLATNKLDTGNLKFEHTLKDIQSLNSCASNVTVVNIDNGFGAGFVASLINRKFEEPRTIEESRRQG